jgi:hypothetical protein
MQKALLRRNFEQQRAMGWIVECFSAVEAADGYEVELLANVVDRG